MESFQRNGGGRRTFSSCILETFGSFFERISLFFFFFFLDKLISERYTILSNVKQIISCKKVLEQCRLDYKRVAWTISCRFVAGLFKVFFLRLGNGLVKA